MNISPLLLDSLYLQESSMSTNNDTAVTDFSILPSDLKAEVELFSSKNNDKWLVVLQVALPESKTRPYNFKIVATGTFRVDKEYPEEKQYQLVYVNGASILYGFIREIVVTLTARGRWPTLVLPTVCFYTDYREKQLEAMKAEANEDKAEPKALESGNKAKRKKKGGKKHPGSG